MASNRTCRHAGRHTHESGHRPSGHKLSAVSAEVCAFDVARLKVLFGAPAPGEAVRLQRDELGRSLRAVKVDILVAVGSTVVSADQSEPFRRP
eukprot:CAMPEP_0175474358 /NCGR_PEP_ID=MMETSP0095-20121207/74857_1 /TAXON_ID=311494 /ORGANISM="Alexandrium monilatum, Strain CCMP3105" /LENGTH=92 /DNA_ID=CAMNT_0016775885 /DNA_START=14 /DNA_END=288 /DNA_ORIENTATION=+